MTTEKKQLSTDGVMRNVACTLIRDFRRNLNDEAFCDSHYVALKTNDINAIRGSVPVMSQSMDVSQYKAAYQMNSLLKRYRFENDLFSDSELVEASIASFKATQDRIRLVNLNDVSAKTKHIMKLARIYIARVLGVYSDEVCRDLCRFGRRASAGIPSRKACEAERWEVPLTGSLNQISWFDSEMSQIDQVQDYWTKLKGSDPNGSTYREIDSLKLSLVPKTFKSLRAIMPNSTIGSYMSYGLGDMMRKGLRRNGYDISKLQMEHRSLAARGSVHSQYVTMDLSSASDSISVALVESLFPSDWVDILTQSRIAKVCLPDGSECESLTFCTMGVGYTFPLQTLVFLSFLKAIHFYVNRRSRATISVYGDDMIFHRSLYDTVVGTFAEVGFVVNVDKTFHDGHFRESCGGDYYHGVDVRPFQPRNGSAFLGPKAYEAMLYKFINGLLMRWSEHEVSDTLNYLLSEIGRVTGKAKVVPLMHPDDSGIRVSLSSYPVFLSGRTDVTKPKHIGHGVYRFPYLRFQSEEREELRHEPYYWLSLRGGIPAGPYGPDGFLRRTGSTCQLVINHMTGVASEKEPLLIWREDPTLTRRSKISSRRQRRLVSYVTVSNTGRYSRQSGTSCFEGP